MKKNEFMEQINYEGIIATRNWDGVVGAGLLSRVFGELDVEFKNQINSAYRKIIVKTNLIGYIEVNSCLVIVEDRDTPSFFLFGNTLLDGSDYPTASAFIAEIFDLNVPKAILTSLKELNQGHIWNTPLSRFMTIHFLSNIENLEFKSVFNLVRDGEWEKFNECFSAWASKIKDFKSSTKQGKEISKTKLLAGKIATITYPLGEESIKNNALMTAMRLQKKREGIFLFGEKGGVIPDGLFITERDLDLSSFHEVTEDETWERLGKYNILRFSFNPPQRIDQIKKLVSRHLSAH